MSSVICPGMDTEIIPPHRQVSFETSSSAGMFASSTVAAPGAHGATVFGMHGIGVRTPSAAAVAAATVGLAGLVHMPNGMMLTIGLWSMMLAAGTNEVMTRFTGSTTSVLGA